MGAWHPERCTERGLIANWRAELKMLPAGVILVFVLIFLVGCAVFAVMLLNYIKKRRAALEKF